MANVVYKGVLAGKLTIDDYKKNQTEQLTIDKDAITHAQMLNEFLKWVSREYNINGWCRSKKYNESVGGISTSNHLPPATATDISFKGFSSKDYANKFNKYALKWQEICEKHKVVGEIGLYDNFMHFGSFITYSKKFTRFDKRTKK